MIADNTIVSADLKDGAAVRSSDIVDGQVNTVDLAANAVTSDKIKNGQVKAEDLDPGIQVGGGGGGSTPNFGLQVTERSNTIQTPEQGGPFTLLYQIRRIKARGVGISCLQRLFQLFPLDISNPRVLSDMGLAIPRPTRLGDPRSFGKRFPLNIILTSLLEDMFSFISSLAEATFLQLAARFLLHAARYC
jgi:hypothetical protein